MDLLRGDNAIGQQKEEDGSDPAPPVDTYNGNDVRTPEAKMSFKKKLLQRKRDAMLLEESSAVSGAGSDSSASGITDPESVAAVDSIDSVGVSVPVKAGVKSFQGNTEYSQYKDEYNEQEGGDARYFTILCKT